MTPPSKTDIFVKWQRGKGLIVYICVPPFLILTPCWQFRLRLVCQDRVPVSARQVERPRLQGRQQVQYLVLYIYIYIRRYLHISIYLHLCQVPGPEQPEVLQERAGRLPAHPGRLSARAVRLPGETQQIPQGRFLIFYYQRLQ